jgi:hypothetical protein
MSMQFRNPASEMYGYYMTGVHERLSKQLETVQESMAKYYNKQRRSIENFRKGELVMLNGKHILWKGCCWKLDDKMYGLFIILLAGHNDRYCKLELPAAWKIHPKFNIALLDRYRGKNPDREVVEIEANDAGWKMEMVIGSGLSNNDAAKHVYLIKWEGYSHQENMWEMFENVNEHGRELLEEYYTGNANMEKDKRFGKKKPRQRDAEGA